jgi:hypothetical protein
MIYLSLMLTVKIYQVYNIINNFMKIENITTVEDYFLALTSLIRN